MLLVFVANLCSTLFAGMLPAFLLTVVTLVAGTRIGNYDHTIGKVIFATGTWVMDDNPPFLRVGVAMTIAGFIATYFLTVFVEYRFLTSKRFLVKTKELFPLQSIPLFKHSFFWNLLSYAGLAAVCIWLWAGNHL